MAHRTAPLSELGRLRLARAIVDQGWPVARTAERFQVSRPTAHRWATRLDVKKLANIPAGVAIGSWAGPPVAATARPTAPAARRCGCG